MSSSGRTKTVFCFICLALFFTKKQLIFFVIFYKPSKMLCNHTFLIPSMIKIRETNLRQKREIHFCRFQWVSHSLPFPPSIGFVFVPSVFLHESCGVKEWKPIVKGQKGKASRVSIVHVYKRGYFNDFSILILCFAFSQKVFIVLIKQKINLLVVIFLENFVFCFTITFRKSLPYSLDCESTVLYLLMI